MKPEEFPCKTSCKYTYAVTGVLELFERIIVIMPQVSHTQWCCQGMVRVRFLPFPNLIHAEIHQLDTTPQSNIPWH